MKICDRCSAENLPDSVFCSSCGVEANWVFKCPQCGSESPAAAAYCSECGWQFDRGAASEATPVPKQQMNTGQSKPANQASAASIPNEAKTNLKRKIVLFLVIVAIVFAVGIGASLLNGKSKPNATSSGNSSGGSNSLVLSEYEQTCQSGGWSFGDLTGVQHFSGLVKTVECNNGDAEAALSQLFVLSEDSNVQPAIQALTRSGWNCYLVGPNWVMTGQPESPGLLGPVSALQDVQAERAAIGGSIQGSCS